MLIDWESIYYKKVRKSFDELVDEQAEDLVYWQQRSNIASKFQKRFLCENELVKWNDNKPFPLSLNSDKELYVTKEESGIYLIRKLDEGACQLISGFALLHHYSISNKYLSNAISPFIHPSVEGISLEIGDYEFRDLFFFSINATPNRIIDLIAMIFIICSFFLLYFNFSTKSKAHFYIVTLLLVGIRLLSLLLDLLPEFIRYPVFDSIHYYSSFLNPNLGDLLINVFSILLVILCFSKTHVQPSRSGYLILIAGVFISLLLTQFYFLQVSILDNSQIALDVSASINFSLMRLTAFAVLVAFAFGCLILWVKFFRYTKGRLGLYYLLGLSMVPMLVMFFDWKAAVLGLGLLVCFLIIRLFQPSSEVYNPVHILLFTVVLSFSGSLTIYKYYEKEIVDSKRKFGNYLLIKRDILGEFYISEILDDLKKQKVPNDSNTYIHWIKDQFSGSYFKKFDISFKAYGDTLYQTDATEYPNISFINERNINGYVCELPKASFSMLLIFKKILPTSVFPEVLEDDKYLMGSSNFDYAVYRDGEILYQRSQFGQGVWLSNEQLSDERLYLEGIESKGNHYFGIVTNDERTIIISSPLYPRSSIISNFFFQLILFFSVFNLSMLAMRVHSVRNTFGFSAKLQFYMGTSLVVPLLVTAFALIRTINRSYHEEIARNYIKEALNVTEVLEEWNLGVNNLNQRLSEVSRLVQADVSYYSKEGRVVASSQPDIYKLNLQSKLINPIVFRELIDKGNQSLITEESIGRLDYKVCYASVNDQFGNLSGIVAIPFFDSKNHLKRQKQEVFGIIVTIFGSVFSLAIFFGNLFLKNLMRPLKLVAEKIKQTNLEEVNTPIHYDKNDEIGSLVSDFNQMLVKLEESKEALAKSQKEAAWKGIAKQVAHEIKNPLTPMQLKIQQLLRKHDPESKEYITLNAILKQVDILSQIASSFSAFADLPSPENKVINFSRLVADSVSFHMSEEVEINVQIQNDLKIFADKRIFERILNNLILNAIQSVPDGLPQLEVALKENNKKAVLSIKDNGRGIPDDLKEKIFVNYFSTKSSGSGIGLALAKKGIENIGGNIWFETEEGKGTVFFVSIPLADS